VRVGDLVRCKFHRQVGLITKVNKRDLSFYKSHTYYVEFVNGIRGWQQEFELEALCKSEI